MATGRDPARHSLVLGVLSLALWPVSFAWVPAAGCNADWILMLVPLAELGALACAVAAIVAGLRARRRGVRSTGATWGPRLGGLTLCLVVLGNVLGAAPPELNRAVPALVASLAVTLPFTTRPIVQTPEMSPWIGPSKS